MESGNENEVIPHLNSFKWTIPGFKDIVQRGVAECHESQVFTAQEQKWQLKLHSRAKLNEKEGVSVTLKLIKDENNKSASSISVQFSLSISILEGGGKISEFNINKRFDDGKSHGAFLIEREQLLTMHNLYMPQGQLTIICDVKKCELVAPIQSNHLAKVQEIFKENKSGAYSPVFKTMLNDQEFQEGKDGIIEMECDVDALQQLIIFVHGGLSPTFRDEQMTENLLDLAERYDIQELKTICLYHLQVNLNENNALHTIILAERYNSKNLVNLTMDFIINNIENVVSSPSYSSLPNQYHTVVWKILKNLIKK